MLSSAEFHDTDPLAAVRVLLVGDDPRCAGMVRARLGAASWAQLVVEWVGTLEDALARLPQIDFDLVIADLDTPACADLAMLDALARATDRPILVLSADPAPRLREAALQRGAYELLQKDGLEGRALDRVARLAVLHAKESAARKREALERKEAEEVLRESEERFRSLTALSADWYWEQDHEFRLTFMSDRVARKTGLDPSGYIGRRRWDTPALNLSEADWDRHRAQLERHEPFHDFEMQRPAGERGSAWVSLSGEPVFDASGAFKGYRGIGRDITGAKRAAGLLGLEHAVTRRLADAGSVSEALRAVMQAICEAENWDNGRYFELDQAGGVMRFRESWARDDEAARRYSEASRGYAYRPGQGLLGAAWLTGQPVWVADMERDARVAHPGLARETGMRGAFNIPVAFGGCTIGIISITSRHVREPDERLLQALGIIGSQIGQYLQRMRAEEDQRRFRLALDNSGDMITIIDRATMRFVDVNHTVCRLLGYSREEMLAMGPEHVLFLGRADLEAGYDALIAEPSSIGRVNSAFRCKDGSTLPFESTRRALRSGERWIITAISRDIRGRLAAQEVQRRSEDELRRFRTALDASADMVFLVDMKTTRLLDFNQTVCETLGYAREELLGCESARLRVGRTTDELLADYARLLASPARAETIVGAYRRKGGAEIPCEIRRTVLETPDGPILVINTNDLTERKLAEARQAANLRFQEKIARFGQSALAKRQAADLVDEAVQHVLEALRAHAVAYVEPGPQAGALLVRAVAGAGSGSPGAAELPDNPVFQVLRDGVRFVARKTTLPFEWARERGMALIPVPGEQGVRGVLCAISPSAAAFAAEELNFLDAAASVLSTGLKRIDSEARLAYFAQFDSLTGLPNRALLADRFTQMIAQAKRRGTPLGVLFIDLDEFKLVNDTLGHAAGDELLKETARRLQASVRSGDTVARISGDEFAVILNELARADDAAIVAQKIIERLAAAVALRGHEVFVTASIGIAAYPADGDDAETLLGAADAAMYRAKQSGRNAYQFFTNDINQRTRARASLGSELRRALEREEFALAYQPKYELQGASVCGAEALLRWNHPQRGPVAPAEFIPVLEETGLIVPVGEWVLRRACADLKAWQAAGLRALPVAVNLSARQFRQPGLDGRIARLLAAAGVDASLIELEITESQLMQDPDQAILVMRALRAAGMRIAIDDFGTGYSSLAYLTRFPVAALKIDRSFVADMLNERSHATIVRTIIDMSHTLGFTVVAEGVENDAQAQFLRQFGCEQAQGYLFARPMPAARFAALLSGDPETRKGL